MTNPFEPGTTHYLRNLSPNLLGGETIIVEFDRRPTVEEIAHALGQTYPDSFVSLEHDDEALEWVITDQESGEPPATIRALLCSVPHRWSGPRIDRAMKGAGNG